MWSPQPSQPSELSGQPHDSNPAPRAGRDDGIASPEETYHVWSPKPELVGPLRMGSESDYAYNKRTVELDLLLRSCWIQIRSWNKYHEYGNIMTEVNSNSIPQKYWTRFQCVVWIKSFYEERLDIEGDTAIHVACRFKEEGGVMLSMDFHEWTTMLGHIDGIPAIYERLNQLRDDGLIDGPESEWSDEENESSDDKSSSSPFNYEYESDIVEEPPVVYTVQ